MSSLPVKTAMRRLADVAFTLQDYETAINTYHSVKKECVVYRPNHVLVNEEIMRDMFPRVVVL